jgi:hypothetical protein
MEARCASEAVGMHTGPRSRFLKLRVSEGETPDVPLYKPEARARGRGPPPPLARAAGLYFPTFFS